MTKDAFLTIYALEATSRDLTWRSLPLTEGLCTQLLEHLPAETLLLSKRLPVAFLATLARSRDPQLRCQVADKRAAAPLLDDLASDEDENVRIRVCYNGKVSRTTLERLATDPSPAVREAALGRLAR